jgi:hypothetical protein
MGTPTNPIQEPITSQSKRKSNSTKHKWSDYACMDQLSKDETSRLKKLWGLSILAGKYSRWGSPEMETLYTYINRHLFSSHSYDFLIADIIDQHILPGAAQAALDKAIARVRDEYYRKRKTQGSVNTI